MIDAYVHCGISRFAPVERVAATMATVGVARAVLVQHLGEYDNRYLEAAVRAHPSTFTAVAMIDPHERGWQAALDAIATSGAFRGIRLTTEMLAGTPRLAVAAAEAGLATVLYAPDGIARATQLINDLAATVPGCTIVVTHLGCPVVEGGRIVAGWDLLDLAGNPGVVVTLSGQGMFCEYPHRELEPFVGRVIQAFGAERVMWGSNYPVIGDADACARDLALVRAGTWGLTQRDVTSMTATSAAGVFFPPTPTVRPHGAA